jgi:hypothetical protein
MAVNQDKTFDINIDTAALRRNANVSTARAACETCSAK